MEGIPDRELAARAQVGDRTALEELIARHQGTVFQMTFRILRHRDDALDAAQDALLRLVRHLKSYRPERPFRPWLRAIALRAALDQAGRGARHPGGGAEPDSLAASGPGPDDQAGSAELSRRVERALAGLSPAQRAAFVCKELEGLDTAAAARVMGCRRSTVRWHLFEARRRLAAALAGAQGSTP